MSDILEAVILGIVQGLTEFLPISSTGHLILAERILGIDGEHLGLRFDASLHLGTLAAVLIYFRARILSLAGAWLASVKARRWDISLDSRMAWLILLGTIPAGIAGYLLESTVESTFREPLLVGAMMLLFTIPMALAERFASHRRTLDSLQPKDALVIGAAQAMALIPGVSRSGITISTGMLSGFQRADAAAFAFLLATPVIAAAGGKQIFDSLTGNAEASGVENEALIYLAGLIAAAVVGYAAVAFLMQFLRVNSLRVFIIYRLIVGTAVVALAAAGIL